MGTKVKVVLDTNVWVSIFLKKIVADEFSRANKNLTVYISEEIILEISKVLLYPKIAKILRKVNINEKEILDAIKENSVLVKPKVKLNIIEEDVEDNKILECAEAAGAVFIVSGDKHLLKLCTFRKSRVLLPIEFFDYIIQN